MKVKVNDKEVEAYHLIMRKENALEILNGTKKIEIRDYSDKYCGMFYDKDKLAKANEVFEKTGNSNDEQGTSLFEKSVKNTRYICFTNYNKSWSLIIEVTWFYILSLTKENVQFLNDEFDFHDLDNDWQEFEDAVKKEKYDEIPSFWALQLGKVISHENLRK